VMVGDITPITGIVRPPGTPVSVRSDSPETPIAGYPAVTTVALTPTSLPSSQTGYFQQIFTISNTTGSTIDAVRVMVSNLPAGVYVANAAGTEGGGQFVLYNQALMPGQVVNLVIEFYVPGPGLIPTAARFTQEVILPMTPPSPVGTILTGVTVSRDFDNRYVLDFLSILGRTYYVQYSDDGVTWKTVFSPLTGNGTRVVWLDNGPPKTDADSSGAAVRFYRVILI
jgi:hypothetical protein